MSNTFSTIASPCILVCAIEPQSGYCYGCGRSRDEIAGWTGYSDAERRALMNALPERVAKLERRPRRITRRQRMAGKQKNPNRERDVLALASALAGETGGEAE